MVLYYKQEDKRTWSDHAGELISTFTFDELVIRFGLSFAWPDFRLPALEMTFTLTFGVVCLTLVGSYLTQALLWCAGEPWFAMPVATPGALEKGLVVAFSSAR